MRGVGLKARRHQHYKVVKPSRYIKIYYAVSGIDVFAEGISVQKNFAYIFEQSKAGGMNPKTLQYLMGHSEIGVTLDVYTHLGLEDAAEELHRMEELQNARQEMNRTKEEAV